MTEQQKPSVGGVVHYVSYGSPVREDGTQAFTSQCRDAHITEVNGTEETVGLCVLNPTGLFFHSIADGGSRYDDGGGAGAPEGGTWHWPERV